MDSTEWSQYQEVIAERDEITEYAKQLETLNNETVAERDEARAESEDLFSRHVRLIGEVGRLHKEKVEARRWARKYKQQLEGTITERDFFLNRCFDIKEGERIGL